MISASLRTHFSETTTQHTQTQEDDFNQKVLQYIKAHHPEDDLSTLLDTLKMLAPHHRVTLPQLSTALNYASSTLNQDASEAHYSRSVLNQRAMALIGVNAFFTLMTNRFFSPDENDIKIEQW